MEFHELANIFPMMNTDEYQKLKADISTSGFDSSLPIILHENKILDGRNRYKACEELGIKPAYTTFNNGDPLSYVVRANLHRRHLQPGQLAFVALDIEKHFAEKAKENLTKSTGRPTDNKPFAILQKVIEETKPIHAVKEAAKTVGVGARYVSDAKKIQKEAPELAKQIIAGEMTIPEAKRVIKRKEVIQNLESIQVQEAKAIEGVYDVIVIDPPWNMQKIERDVAPEQVAFEYPTMTLDEIAEINIPKADNCHVFLWTTQKFLPDAINLLSRWGLKYVCTFVWHKNGGFQPFGMPQYNCEFVLYARFGTPEFIDFKNFFTCFIANRTKHSEKPEEFYEMLRRVTAGRRLDMFNRRHIDGFDVWGKEAQ
jgi:N6-adenosine-specific RNA methylase IME4